MVWTWPVSMPVSESLSLGLSWPWAALSPFEKSKMAATGCSSKCFLTENEVKYGCGWLTVVIKVVELNNTHVLSPNSSPHRTNGSWDDSKLTIFFLNKRSSYLQQNLKKFTERSILQKNFQNFADMVILTSPFRKKIRKNSKMAATGSKIVLKTLRAFCSQWQPSWNFVIFFFWTGTSKLPNIKKFQIFFV